MIKKYQRFLEQLILEYQYNPKQEEVVRKWLSKRGIETTEPQTNLLTRFFNAYPKLKIKDINQYRTLEDLEKALSEAESFITVKQQKKQLKQDAEKVNIGDKTVILTFTPESSQFYGAGTRWCTSMKNEIYHWLLHRIIGVEFYIVNNNPTDEESNQSFEQKISVHINWDEQYATVYNADNTCDFSGIIHEYTDLEGLRQYLKNDDIFNWIVEQFRITKQDAPKFVNSYLKQLVDQQGLLEMFNRYNYFVDATDEIIYHFGDELNPPEFETMSENYTSSVWFEDFKTWLRTLNYQDILNYLGVVKEIQKVVGVEKVKRLKKQLKGTKGEEKQNILDLIFKYQRHHLDDHVFITELFKYFIKQRPTLRDEYMTIPYIWDDDEDWLDMISRKLLLDPDELEDDFEEIDEFYADYDYKKVKRILRRMDIHKKILIEYFGS